MKNHISLPNLLNFCRLATVKNKRMPDVSIILALYFNHTEEKGAMAYIDLQSIKGASPTVLRASMIRLEADGHATIEQVAPKRLTGEITAEGVAHISKLLKLNQPSEATAA